MPTRSGRTSCPVGETDRPWNARDHRTGGPSTVERTRGEAIERTIVSALPQLSYPTRRRLAREEGSRRGRVEHRAATPIVIVSQESPVRILPSGCRPSLDPRRDGPPRRQALVSEPVVSGTWGRADITPLTSNNTRPVLE